MCVPLAFSLLNRFTHNLPLEAPSNLYTEHGFRRYDGFVPYLIVAGAENGNRTRTPITGHGIFGV